MWLVACTTDTAPILKEWVYMHGGAYDVGTIAAIQQIPSTTIPLYLVGGEGGGGGGGGGGNSTAYLYLQVIHLPPSHLLIDFTYANN